MVRLRVIILFGFGRLRFITCGDLEEAAKVEDGDNMELPCLKVAAIIAEPWNIIKMTRKFYIGGGHGGD